MRPPDWCDGDACGFDRADDMMRWSDKFDHISDGTIKRWSENRWRWEFTRRRKDSRDDFDRHAAESYARSIEFHKEYDRSGTRLTVSDVLKPTERGFHRNDAGTDEVWAGSSLTRASVNSPPRPCVPNTVWPSGQVFRTKAGPRCNFLRASSRAQRIDRLSTDSLR
jgi:hypothetical protein